MSSVVKERALEVAAFGRKVRKVGKVEKVLKKKAPPPRP